MMKPASVLLLAMLLFVSTLIAQPKYEFRGVWIATVENIDFPSSTTLSTAAQKAEFISILDMHKRNGMNAMVVQIRPVSDAFYPSQLEPWSEYLTGKQGAPPSPYYDPLKFMITETHKRGMEFHAWMNPYRAVFNVNNSSIAPTHITRTHPEWFVQYGSKMYFDPGNKEAQKFVGKVVRDVVRRYDVDAIHFDDYFYPYRIRGKEFPDDKTYAKNGNGMARDDWRRSNVDSIIVHLSRIIKEENPYCKFGISPFGVWRNYEDDPQGSKTTAGQTNYDDLYADILLWLRKGWIDYVVPQLYWEIGHDVVGFEVLSKWWAAHAYGRQMYIGQGIYRAVTARSGAWTHNNELPRQIRMLRQYPQIQGSVFFSSKSFASNPNGWSDSLRRHYYKYPAIIPPMSWIDSEKPQAPKIIIDKDDVLGKISFYLHQDTLNEMINRYIIYAFDNEEKLNIENPRNIHDIIPRGMAYYSFDAHNIPPQQSRIVLAATALTSTNNESGLSNKIYLERVGDHWRVIQ